MCGAKKNTKGVEDILLNIHNFNINSIKKIEPKEQESRLERAISPQPPSPENGQHDCPICYGDEEEIIELECKHSLCTKCASRIFYLMKNPTCPVCKQISNINPPKHYLLYKCQKCNFIANTAPQLINHYKKHNLVTCFECIDNKHEFPSEYILYSIDMLLKHRVYGLKEENQCGFYGHIHCCFCNKYFYDADVCKKHCRVVHCICTICESVGHRHNYYRNITELNQHLKEMHFVCCFNECNGIVFGYQSALDEHLYKRHNVGNGSINLTVNKKVSTVKAMCPYDIENDNKNLNRKKTTKTPPIIQPPKQLVPIQENTTLPLSLIRTVQKTENIALNLQLEFLKKNYKDHFEELFQKSTKYQQKEITAQIFLECAELLLGGKETIKFADVISRYYEGEPKRVLVEYLREYKKIVMFPKFATTQASISAPPKKEGRRLKFKVFEIKKK